MRRATARAVARALALACALLTRATVARATDARDGAMVTRARYDVDGALDADALRARGVDTRAIRVTLRTDAHGTLTAKVRGDGTFAVRDAPAGRHVLDVHAVGLNFPPVAVRVVGADEDDDDAREGDVEAHLAEDRAVRVPTKPLRLTPVSTLEYFEPATRVTPASAMKNPMALLVLASVFLAFVAPKILEGIDPEELKRMQEELTGAARGETARGDAAE
jgi:hypothetical protein